MKRRDLCGILGLAGPDEEEMDRTWQKLALGRIKKIMDERLTGRQKEIIMLYYYEGLSQREIASRLGIAESTVSRTKHRGLRRLEYDLRLIGR